MSKFSKEHNCVKNVYVVTILVRLIMLYICNKFHEVPQRAVELSSGLEIMTDRQTDRQADNVITRVSANFVWRGYNEVIELNVKISRGFLVRNDVRK